MRDYITDEEVEAEIDRLNNSEDVKLALKEIRVKNRRRQRMYYLRSMEKRGKELKRQGIDSDRLDEMYPVEDDSP